MLSQYQANPRVGHLEVAYHIFAYLKKHPDMGKLVYDPIKPPANESAFRPNADFSDFYGKVEEELLPNMPEPHGNKVTLTAFVDANHAGNIVTRRYSSFAHRYHHLCTECTNHILLQASEHT